MRFNHMCRQMPYVLLLLFQGLQFCVYAISQCHQRLALSQSSQFQKCFILAFSVVSLFPLFPNSQYWAGSWTSSPKQSWSIVSWATTPHFLLLENIASLIFPMVLAQYYITQVMRRDHTKKSHDINNLHWWEFSQ